MENSQTNSRILYLVLGVLFIISTIFNDFIGIAGIHPDILLIILFFLVFNEKPIVVIIAAFVFGFLQDILLPGSVQYWGLSPLFKTLIAYILLKLLPFIQRFKGFIFYVSLFASMFIYYIFYNLLYYSGYVKPFIILYRYTIPETLYTFLLLLIINAIFPIHNKNGK